MEEATQGSSATAVSEAEAYSSLADSNLLSRRTLDEAAGVSRRTGQSLGWVLWRRYYVPHHMIGQALQAYYGCPYWEYEENATPARDLGRAADESAMRSGCWAPLWRQGETVCVVVDDPASTAKLAQIQDAFPGKRLLLNVGLKEDILRLTEGLIPMADRPR